jgi:predicted permease
MLVVGEVALAVLLAVGAQLLVRSFADLRRLDPGFRTTHLVSARLTPSATTFSQAQLANQFYATVLARLAALPGVQRVGAISGLPLARPNYSMAIRVEGQFENYKSTLPMIDHFSIVTPGFMPAVGLRLLAGRGFTADDQAGTQPVAIVSQSMAKHYWPAGDAIGKRIGYPYESPWLTIVGIVGDIANDSLRDTKTIAAYIPFSQRQVIGVSREMTVVAATSGDGDGDGDAVRRELPALVAGVDRTVPVSEIRTMDDVVSHSMAGGRFTMILVGAFALVALVLGAVGIYGVMSYVVSQRTVELSVRTALGASSWTILRMVVSRAAALAGVGAAIGMVAAALALRPLRAMLYGVTITDPATYVGVSALFICVALAASAAPARRAARTNPAGALRAD